MHHNHYAGHQHHHANMEKRQEGPGTVVQYVYKTAAKTFDGPVGGYMTMPAAPESTPDSNPNSNSNSDDNSNDSSNANSNAESQQAAQVSAAEAEASASAVSAAISEASASNAAAATTQAAHTQNDEKTQVTSTPDNKKTTPTSSPLKAATSSRRTPAAAATSQASSPSPTSSFLESASSTTPSHTAAASTGSSGGMSSGGKAGLAIGILLALGALFALAFFIYRRKRSQSNEAYSKADNEKSDFTGGLERSQSTVSTRTTATAPRLSLRPITEFHPDLAARGKAANAGGAAAAGVAGGAAVGAAMSMNQNDPANPFGNHAAVTPSRRLSDEKIGLPIQSNASENPFADNAGAPPPTNGSMPLADAPAPLRIRTPSPHAVAPAGAAAVVGATAGAAAAAKLGERKDAPKPLNLNSNRAVTPGSHSPAVSEFSQTPVSPGAMANGPSPSNVHRIQLDFKPSMDDELSLRAGQLVRLLHEYDDGWALCIRLDRSQQGVAPRTCLSARPVKPRPPPAARGPGPRGPPPPGMVGPGSRSASPAPSGRGSPSPYGRVPRPSTAGAGSQQRSMSPGPYGGGPQRPANMPPPGAKRRSNSASDVRERRMSPPGPSPMNPNIQKVSMQQQAVNSPESASITSRSSPTSMMPPRKPVPGQAM